MAKKPTPKNTEVVFEDDPKTEKVELAREVEVEEETKVKEKPVVKEPEVVEEKTIEDVSEDTEVVEEAPVKRKKESDEGYDLLAGIGISVKDYAHKSSREEAVRLLQKILNIAKTGDIDEMTVAAWKGSVAKFELIDDYNNMRKDTDSSRARQASKKFLREA